jgi:hypothetical protein
MSLLGGGGGAWYRGGGGGGGEGKGREQRVRKGGGKRQCKGEEALKGHGNETLFSFFSLSAPY